LLLWLLLRVVLCCYQQVRRARGRQTQRHVAGLPARRRHVAWVRRRLPTALPPLRR